jgi:hypothetical protein
MEIHQTFSGQFPVRDLSYGLSDKSHASIYTPKNIRSQILSDSHNLGTIPKWN